MSEQNWLPALSAIAAVLVATLNYFKSRKVDERAHKIEYVVNGRFEDLLVENRRLREMLAAETGVPEAVKIVNDVVENRERSE